MNQKTLLEMDKEADKMIRIWSLGVFTANFLPTPIDILLVSGIFAKMGDSLATVYKIKMDFNQLKIFGRAIAKGIGASLAANYIGMTILQFIPWMNIWVILIIQPPIVAAIAYSVGNAFKKYYHVKITDGKDLTAEDMKKLAEQALKEKLGNFKGL